jgi:hypothetical protein
MLKTTPHFKASLQKQVKTLLYLHNLHVAPSNDSSLRYKSRQASRETYRHKNNIKQLGVQEIPIF